MSWNFFSTGALSDATKMNDNFYYAWDGNRLPLSGNASTTLTAADNTWDLGSSDFRWADVYCNNLYISGTVTSYHVFGKIYETVLSTASYEFEITGLNGDNYSQIIINMRAYTSCAIGVQVNGYSLQASHSIRGIQNLAAAGSNTVTVYQNYATAPTMSLDLFGSMLIYPESGKHKVFRFTNSRQDECGDVFSRYESAIAVSTDTNTLTTLNLINMSGIGHPLATGTVITIYGVHA